MNNEVQSPETPLVGKQANRFLRSAREVPAAEIDPGQRIDWPRSIPFIFMHVMCVGVFWVSWSATALGVAAFLYGLRVFALTGFYHRYFSHRTFKTSRAFQFLFAVCGCASVQRGPLWWAAHHRHHHVHSDDPQDLHSPLRHGFLWSHFGWFLTPYALPTNLKLIPDFAKFWELRFLDKNDNLIPMLLAGVLYGTGAFLELYVPELGTTGLQLLFWGFFISTVMVYHVTYLVNSAAHLVGNRRYQTKDDNRNCWWVALLTFGEGWHNNHHYYPNSTRQGFFWWEIDFTYYILKGFSLIGLVWDLRPVPQRILHAKDEPETASSCALPS